MRAETKTAIPIMSASRHFYRLILALTCLSITVATHAAEESDTKWGSAPGLTVPHPDSKGRAGYWWWPKPEADAAQQERPAGNHGRVYGAWETAEESPSAPVDPPYPDQTFTREPEKRLILNGVLFPFDSAELTGWAEAEIKRTVLQLEWYFKQYMNDRIVCVGHTDDVGSAAYNQGLGARRAQVVMDALIEGGVAPERISTKSVGETQPVVPNDSNENRALNRRVDFEVIIAN